MTGAAAAAAVVIRFIIIAGSATTIDIRSTRLRSTGMTHWYDDTWHVQVGALGRSPFARWWENATSNSNTLLQCPSPKHHCTSWAQGFSLAGGICICCPPSHPPGPAHTGFGMAGWCCRINVRTSSTPGLRCSPTPSPPPTPHSHSLCRPPSPVLTSRGITCPTSTHHPR